MYNCGMGIRRTKHAVFNLKYHLVWIPKYSKHILVGEVAQYAKEVFELEGVTRLDSPQKLVDAGILGSAVGGEL